MTGAQWKRGSETVVGGSLSNRYQKHGSHVENYVSIGINSPLELLNPQVHYRRVRER